MKKQVLFKQVYWEYYTYGNGKPVVLLHGFAENNNIWKDFTAALSQEFKVITPNLPGSGGSEMIPGNEVQIADYAEGIKAILDNEAIENCVMAGHSMGGYIMMAFAKKYPQYLKAMALVHSTAYADTDEKKEARKKAIEFIRSNGSEAFLKTAVPDLFAEKNKFREQVQIIIDMGKDIPAEALIQYYTAMMNRTATDEVLDGIQVPVLFIAGEHDKAVPLQHALEQCHLPGESEISILRNSAHMGMIEEKEKSLQIFTHFLQGVYV